MADNNSGVAKAKRDLAAIKDALAALKARKGKGDKPANGNQAANDDSINGNVPINASNGAEANNQAVTPTDVQERTAVEQEIIAKFSALSAQEKSTVLYSAISLRMMEDAQKGKIASLPSDWKAKFDQAQNDPKVRDELIINYYAKKDNIDLGKSGARTAANDAGKITGNTGAGTQSFAKLPKEQQDAINWQAYTYFRDSFNANTNSFGQSTFRPHVIEQVTGVDKKDIGENFQNAEAQYVAKEAQRVTAQVRASKEYKDPSLSDAGKNNLEKYALRANLDTDQYKMGLRNAKQNYINSIPIDTVAYEKWRNDYIERIAQSPKDVELAVVNYNMAQKVQARAVAQFQKEFPNGKVPQYIQGDIGLSATSEQRRLKGIYEQATAEGCEWKNGIYYDKNHPNQTPSAACLPTGVSKVSSAKL